MYLLLEELDESCQVVLVLTTVSLQITLDDQIAGLAYLSLMADGCNSVTRTHFIPSTSPHLLGYFSSLLAETENFNDDLQDSQISQ